MNAFGLNRRSGFFRLGGFGLSGVFPQGGAGVQPGARQGFVLEPAGGEHLIHFRDHGNIFIKISSDNFAMGTQQVMAGSGIPIHRHFQMDEAFFILDGSGVVTLDDVPHSFEKGGTIFIPKNSWHGFSNPDHELLLLWLVSPAGLDGFFRETCNPPGVPPKQFTREQINEIARKYATEFR